MARRDFRACPRKAKYSGAMSCTVVVAGVAVVAAKATLDAAAEDQS